MASDMLTRFLNRKIQRKTASRLFTGTLVLATLLIGFANKNPEFIVVISFLGIVIYVLHRHFDAHSRTGGVNAGVVEVGDFVRVGELTPSGYPHPYAGAIGQVRTIFHGHAFIVFRGHGHGICVSTSCLEVLH